MTEGHGEYCECEQCEGLFRLNYHRPNTCLWDDDQRRNDGGRGPSQKRQRKVLDKPYVIR